MELWVDVYGYSLQHIVDLMEEARDWARRRGGTVEGGGVRLPTFQSFMPTKACPSRCVAEMLPPYCVALRRDAVKGTKKSSLDQAWSLCVLVLLHPGLRGRAPTHGHVLPCPRHDGYFERAWVGGVG